MAVRRRLSVAPERRPCDAGAGPTECLEVRWLPDGEWELLYDEIEGYQHEPGTGHTLDVEVEEVDAAPADGSTRRIRLVGHVPSEAC